MSRPGSIAWLARHEFRLAWRDWLWLMTAGKRRRARLVFAGFVLFAAFMHLLAYAMVGRFGNARLDPDKATLLIVTITVLLSWSLMLSQAMEMVTRAFYSRADLDLILASPVSARKVFAVRIAAIAVSATMLALPMAAPFIHALAISGGVQWLGAYGLGVAMGCAAAALSVALTVGLFRTLGAKRTRLIAQIIAAIVGAAFVIGIQAAAILSTGTLSRFAVYTSGALDTIAPSTDSLFWWPARAVMGDPQALAGVLGVSFLLLALAIALFSRRFGEHAVAAAGVSFAPSRTRARTSGFRISSPARTLRRKEWTMLVRDPWLVSQSLMQILYLLPPALLLWRTFGEDGAALVVLVPIFVMAAGQLAGGLAWLAVSGEDAPELVATAPVPARAILRAKIEAVIGGIALVLSPLILGLAFTSLLYAAVTLVGVLFAAASATMIQLWFRTQAKRSQFRRRQTSSRMATYAEAFSSISWAATAGLAAAGNWAALVGGAAAIAVLVGARAIRPH
jgi:ABC-2 type transport system permease protein